MFAHPDLKLGRWNIECKAYKKGFEPASAWWEQVLGVTSEGQIPVLVYKFDNKPEFSSYFTDIYLPEDGSLIIE